MNIKRQRRNKQQQKKKNYGKEAPQTSNTRIGAAVTLVILLVSIGAVAAWIYMAMKEKQTTAVPSPGGGRQNSSTKPPALTTRPATTQPPPTTRPATTQPPPTTAPDDVAVIDGFDAFVLATPIEEQQVPRITEMLGKLDGTYRRTTPAAQQGRFNASNPPSLNAEGFFNNIIVNEHGTALAYRWSENTWSFYPPGAQFDGGITLLKIDKPPGGYPNMFAYTTTWRTIPNVVKRNDNLLKYRET